MIILTYLPWHEQFFKFLNILGDIKKIQSPRSFLAQVYKASIPDNGASLQFDAYGDGCMVN